MLQSPKSGKNRKEKKLFYHNTFNNIGLQTSLIIRVFATNFAVGCFHASYERHFVKKIQHLYVLLVAHHRCYIRYLISVFSCQNITLQWKSSKEKEVSYEAHESTHCKPSCDSFLKNIISYHYMVND